MQSHITLFMILLIFFFNLSPYSAISEVNEISRGEATTLIMIRHAERDTGFDPPLNQKGQQRALELLNLFGQSGITRIITPGLKRNMETVIPLSDELGIDPIVFPIEDVNNSTQFAGELIRQIRSDYWGETILFVGNQTNPQNNGVGNLQEMYRLLGGEGVPMTRYSDMYVFLIPKEGKGKIIKAMTGI